MRGEGNTDGGWDGTSGTDGTEGTEGDGEGGFCGFWICVLARTRVREGVEWRANME